MNTTLITYQRSGARTRAMYGDQYIGVIVRKEGSNSSPRGGAYRTFHYPITPAGKKLPSCYTRKEAMEHLLLIAGIKCGNEIELGGIIPSSRRIGHAGDHQHDGITWAAL